MNKRPILEKLNYSTVDEQCDPIFRFIYDNAQSEDCDYHIKAVASPQNFIQGWLGGDVIKVFTQRNQADELVALQVFIVMPDPFDASVKHQIECLKIGGGDDFNQFVSDVRQGF